MGSGLGSAVLRLKPYTCHDVVPADVELTGELLKEPNGVFGGEGGIVVVACLSVCG